MRTTTHQITAVAATARASTHHETAARAETTGAAGS